jgi:predicted nucleic acid-binding protein
MSGRFFLDTNIFACAFDARAPARAKRASQLIRRPADTGKGIVSYQVVQEFFNVAFRRFAQPMSTAEAEQYLITVFGLLATQSSSVLYVGALRIAREYRLAWYDCLIVAAALQGECTILHGEDLQHSQQIEDLPDRKPVCLTDHGGEADDDQRLTTNDQRLTTSDNRHHPPLHKPDLHIRPLLQMNAVDESDLARAQGKNHG